MDRNDQNRAEDRSYAPVISSRVRLFLDPGEVGSEGQDLPPEPPAETSQPNPELAKLARDNERLKKALDGMNRKKEERDKAATALEEKAAEQRGEFEKLYGEEKTKGSALQKLLNEEKEAREGLEDHLKGDVEKALETVEDTTDRDAIKAAIEGLPILKQRSLLSVMLKGRSVQTATPGAVGRGQQGVDENLLGDTGPKGQLYKMELVKARIAKGRK